MVSFPNTVYHFKSVAHMHLTLNTYPCSKDANYTAFLTAISSVNTSSIEAQGHDAVYAFFMNVYNALAIKMIIDHPCSKSLLK